MAGIVVVVIGIDSDYVNDFGFVIHFESSRVII